VKFYKVASLPGSLEPDAFYYVENGSYAKALHYQLRPAWQRVVGNSAMIKR